ncbi:cobyrinate a,c-diamide synthase [Jatrophihabitans sp. DSM 45814]
MIRIPRVVIAAAGSGQGKTSVATGLLAALRLRGLNVSGHKVGPDYIDPGYHALAAGRPGRNLDPWLVGEENIRPMFVHGASTPELADLAVIEGVMGLFDGAVGHGSFASTAHVATLLQAPVVLVVDASAVGRSAAALVHGFATFDPTVRLAGVILNRVGSERHEQIMRSAMDEVGVPVVGVVHRQERLATPARHLGLVPVAERTVEATETVAALGAVVASGVDLEAVIRIASSAPELPAVGASAEDSVARAAEPEVRPVIAVAGGPAFTFGYTETIELLTAAGAEVRTFDPIHHDRLPPGTAGLIIGGGFPEVYAEALSANTALRAEVRELIARDVPISAECAGLLYLTRSLDQYPMVGVLDAESEMGPRLILGYRDAVALNDSVLTPAGARVRGHEFHRTTCTPRSGARPAWRWPDAEPEGFVAGNMHASYLHLHWSGVPGIANRFVAAAIRTGPAPIGTAAALPAGERTAR